jgi:hypothetical protein
MVNKFLNSAIESYPPNLEGRLIHPISKADAEIAVEIGQIFKKLGLDDVKAIWDNYKYLKDTEIAEQLLDWNTQHPVLIDEEEESVGGKKNKSGSFLFIRDFIKFKDVRLELYYIHNWRKKDDYNYTKSRMEFWIIINEVPESIGEYSIHDNKRFMYLNSEVRDTDFQLLDNYMSKHKGINFINE